MVGLVATAFGIAWRLGLYLLARDPGKPVLRQAGLGLIGYAAALVVDQLGPSSGAAHVATVLVCLLALAWSGVFVLLADDSGGTDRWWRFGPPLFAAFGEQGVDLGCGYGRWVVLKQARAWLLLRGLAGSEAEPTPVLIYTGALDTISP